MRRNGPSLPGRWYCGPPLLALAVAGIVLASAVPVQALSVLVSPGADAPAATMRIHPDSSLNLLGPREFNIYTGVSLPAEWQLMDSLDAYYVDGLTVDISSRVYQHNTDGHTLFLYAITNYGPVPVRSGNVAGFAAGWEFLDVGIWHPGGDEDYVTNDVLTLGRPANGKQLDFALQGFTMSGWNEQLLEVDQTTTWFYAVTDAPSWQIGKATVQDSGLSASPVPVLVPVPEPVTMAGMLMAMGGVAAYVRRRQRRK